MDKTGKRNRSYVSCLVIYDLDDSHSEETLKEELGKYGTITYARINVNKTNQRMAFITMNSKEECAAIISNLHQKPPFNWTIKLNEPSEVREHRRLSRQGRGDEEVSPDIQAKVAEYRQYEAEISELISRLTSSLELPEEPAGSVDRRPAFPSPARAGPVQLSGARPQRQPANHHYHQQQPEGGVIYEARLQGRMKRPCCVCRTPTLGHCMRCKARYCSRKCQKQDWELHSIDCREPELPSLVTAAGDGPTARDLSLGAVDGYQSETELNGDGVRGRGAQRGRAGRGYHGGGGDDGRYCRTDVEEVSPGRAGALLGYRPGSVAAAIRPLEAPAQPVLSRLAGQPTAPPRPGKHILKTPPKNPPAAAAVRAKSPPAAPVQAKLPPAAAVQPKSPPAAAVQPKSPPAAAVQPKSPPPAAAVQPKSPPAAAVQPKSPPAAAAKTGPAVYAVTLEPGNLYQMVVSLLVDSAIVYLRPQSGLVDTDSMEQELQSAAAAGLGQKPPAVGELCAGRFEDAWYRGEILSAADGQYQVQFVDWGNTEQLAGTELLPLPARFTGWPRQAVRARLDWRPAGGGHQWSAGQREAADALQQRMVTVRVTGRHQGDVTVSVTDPEGRDLLAVAAAPATATSEPATPVTPVTPAAVPTPNPTAVPTPTPAAATSPASPAVSSPGAAAAAAAAAPASAPRAAAVSLAARLPDNLTPLLTGEPLELAASEPLHHPNELSMVPLAEEFFQLDEELKTLPAEPTVSASAGDVVVALHRDSPNRALVCGTGPNGYRLLFVDTGSVGVSTTPVRPLPARWSLDKLSPMALYVRLADSAPADTRDALLREENLITVKLHQPMGGGTEPLSGHATTPTGISAAVTISSCRALLSQLGGAAPAAEPPASGPVSVQYVRLETGRQHVVLPCAMKHPQCVSAQLQDTAHYRPYLQMADRLKQACAAGCAPPLVPPVGSLLGLYCDAVGPPAAWRRAVLLESRGQQLRLRLVDWAVTVEAHLSNVRVLDSSFFQEKAVGVEFGLTGISKHACPESDMGFYRKKLINLQFLLDVNGEKDAVPQATLNLLSDQKSFCFNEKMLARLAAIARAAAQAQTSVAAVTPAQSPASASVHTPTPAAATAPTTAPAPAPASAHTPSPTPAAATAPTPAPAPAPAATPTGSPVPVAAPAPVSSPAPARSPAPAPAEAAAPPALFTSDLPRVDLKPGDKVPFVVTEVLSAVNVYGTPLTETAVESATALESLLPQLGPRAPPLAQPQPEQLLLAPDTDSDGWARGVLLEVSEDAASVWLVDHGRLAEVPADQLRLLHPDLAKHPPGAVEITLTGYASLSERHEALARQSLAAAADEPLELEIVSATEEGVSVRAPAIDAQLEAAGATI